VSVGLRRYVDQEIIRFCIQSLWGHDICERLLEFGKELIFDAQKQVAWRAEDLEAYSIIYPGKRFALHRILKIANLFFRGENLGLMIEPKDDIKGLVVYPRDSVIVVAAKSLGVVTKIIRKTSNQKDIVKKECLAHKLLPEFVPAIVKYQGNQNSSRVTSFDYVTSEFAENNFPVRDSQWHTVLPDVMDALLLCYERAGFRQTNITNVMDYAVETTEKHNGESEFSRLSRRIIQNILDICTQFREAKLLTTFVHGDVTPACVHGNGDSIKIIDWGSAGYRSVFYDLFTQEFYRASPKFWGNLLKADSNDFFSGHFFGAFNSFYNNLKAKTGTDFSFFDIKANLLVSLLAKSVNSLLRYRVVNEQEGIEFFRHIERIESVLCAAN